MQDQPDAVRAQYEAWPYPQPVADLAAFPGRELIDPSYEMNLYRFWPAGRDLRGARILVAGCGSNQGASIAFRNPDAEVSAIDVSEQSLGNEASLRDKHGLGNLRLRRLPIERARELETAFDLILCTGVIHHLESPVHGLRCLREVLAPGGRIGLMVYGKYLRAGVHMLQSLFRRLAVDADRTGVDLVNATLAALPPHHFARAYVNAAADLKYDGGVVDTFLHSRETAYSVEEVLALVADAGLKFQSWLRNRPYYPNATVPPDHPLWQRLGALPEPEIWAAMELLGCSLGSHSMILCDTLVADDEARPRIAPGNFHRLVPMWCGARVVRDGANAVLVRRRERWPLTGPTREIALGIDGVSSVAALAAHCEPEVAASFLASLWRLDCVVFRVTG